MVYISVLRTVTSSYYRGAHGFLLCYDITNRESFEDVRVCIYYDPSTCCATSIWQSCQFLALVSSSLCVFRSGWWKWIDSWARAILSKLSWAINVIWKNRELSVKKKQKNGYVAMPPQKKKPLPTPLIVEIDLLWCVVLYILSNLSFLF